MAPTAILIDDEPLARDHLRRKLQRLWPELVLLGDADSGAEGLTMIREVDPDIVFLDIKCLACQARCRGGHCQPVRLCL